MAFDLHITFAGMCLFVPDKKNGQDVMHVLLPSTEHGHGGGMSHHLSQLLYKPEHDPGKSASEALEKPMEVPLRDRLLDLTHLGDKSSYIPPDFSGVVDLNEAAERKVDRAFLDEVDTGGRVVTRVTLAAGSASIPERSKGGKWRLGHISKQMATGVEWTISDVQGDFLELELEGMNRDVNQPPHVLRLEPVADGGKQVIHLWLYHSPESEIPGELPPSKIPRTPNPGEKAEHFAAFYNLTGAPVPVFEEMPKRGKDAPALLGDELNCIVATAPAGT